MIEFNYILENAGWAKVLIGKEQQWVEMTVSYLHNSLEELINGFTCLLQNEVTERTVVFMDEPGEHHLILKKEGEQLIITVKWYDDWTSWGMYPKEKHTVVFEGKTTVFDFAKQVEISLDTVYLENGTAGYKAKWIEHDFPFYKYKKMKKLLSNNEI